MGGRVICPKLTAEQLQTIENIESPCLTEDMLAPMLTEWKMTWHSLKRRAWRSGIETKFGYSWMEFQANQKLHSKYNKNNLYIQCPCGKDYVCIVFGFVRRKHQKPVCDSCYKEQFAYDTEWRANNSKAQLIAQNRPETLARQTASQKRRHAQPGMKEKYRQIGKRLWESAEYRENVIKNSIAISGMYEGLTYQSSYELAFIIWSLEKGYSLKRFDLEGIPYVFEGKEHRYYPDFIVNQNRIVEVKGRGGLYYKKLQWRCNAKDHALKAWCKDNEFYARLVFDSDIPKQLIKEARKWHKENNIGKANKKDSIPLHRQGS